MNMHKKDIIQAGLPVDEASKALIMLHGRGASAEDILSLSKYLHLEQFALFAPQAMNHTWYPFSFLVPQQQNEPWLSSALQLVDDLVMEIEQIGFDNIYLLGFSQGACLTLEYAARHPRRYGGVVAFTGGLIGDKVDISNYSGKFEGTTIFIGSSDPDHHVPVERVNESAEILSSLGAKVTKKIYPDMGHTISADEISLVNELIFR